jgi:hypothetical protein
MSVEKHKGGIRHWMTETKRENRTESFFSSSGLCRSIEQLHRRSGWSRWAGLLLLSTLCAVAVARRIPGPPITLPVRRVRLEQTPEQMTAQMRDGLASRILIQDANAVVAQFEGRAGIFRYETVELIRFSDQGVTFEHLRGPFQSCVERFEFVPLADGAYAFEHQGTFVMRGGSLGWLFGILVIRGVFDRLVAKHMQTFSGATDS